MPTYKQPKPAPLTLKPEVDKHSTPVTIGPLKEVKTTGIKMRGAGAATRGFMSRGPMA
jgi:hypothetical protein